MRINVYVEIVFFRHGCGEKFIKMKLKFFKFQFMAIISLKGKRIITSGNARWMDFPAHHPRLC